MSNEARALRIRQAGAKRLAARRWELATTHHVNTRGQPMDFDRYHFWNEIYKDESFDIALRCCVQEGKTEFEVIDSFAASEIGLHVFTVLPKFELRGVHVATRVDRLIATVPEYARMIVDAEGGRDSTAIKHMGLGSIRYVGSNVPNELIAFSADMLVIDELDSCALINMPLAEDRYQRSDFRFTRRVSTPTTPGSENMMNIDYYFTDSNQKHYHIPCPHCNYWQPLDWYKNVVREERSSAGVLKNFHPLDTEWRATGRKKIRIFCVKCHQPLNRNAVGRWVSHRPEVDYRTGYTISKLYSPLTTLDELMRTFGKSVNNPSAMQRFHNSLLGVPYVGVGDKITEHLLNNAANIQPYHIPCSPLTTCSMGIDVNMPFFAVRISDFPFIEDGVLYRRCVFAGEVSDVKQLHELIALYNVSTCVIDAQPEIRLAQEFQRDAKCIVYRCRYEPTEGVAVKDLVVDDTNGIVSVDRTSSLDLVLKQYLDGLVLLPRNYEEMANGKFSKQMCASVRRLEITDRGVQRYVWVRSEDHQFHADNYDMIASRLGGFSPCGTVSSCLTMTPKNYGPDITGGAAPRAYEQLRLESPRIKTLEEILNG